MGIFEIISAIILIIACVFIVVVVLMKDTKTQMSQTISGSTSDSYFQKNAGRTKEAMLNKAAIVFFVLALGVNVINVYWGAGSDNNSSSAPTSSVSSDSSTGSDSTDSSDSGSDNSTSSDNSTDSESGSDTSSDSSAGTSSTTE